MRKKNCKIVSNMEQPVECFDKKCSGCVALMKRKAELLAESERLTNTTEELLAETERLTNMNEELLAETEILTNTNQAFPCGAAGCVTPSTHSE